MTDDDLLALFHRRPTRAWHLFLERYAGRIIAQLRASGLDADEAMGGFVFVCERLADDRFRRLRQVKKTGERGELVPWLRRVVGNSAIEYGWSRHGRSRLYRSVADLSDLDRRVFQLHFWHGLGPAAIVEALRSEGSSGAQPEQVFDALERVLGRLDSGQRWRLLSRLARHRNTRPIAVAEPQREVGWEPASRDPDPEMALLHAERARRVDQALAQLTPRDRLIFRLRYDDGLTLPDIAALVSLGLTTVKSSLRNSREQLRQACQGMTP